MNIHEFMSERVQLAAIYAEDGAFYTASDILRALADYLQSHADKFNAEIVKAAS